MTKLKRYPPNYDELHKLISIINFAIRHCAISVLYCLCIHLICYILNKPYQVMKANGSVFIRLKTWPGSSKIGILIVKFDANTSMKIVFS